MQVRQNIGIACSTWSLGDCKSLDYNCHLTHFCILFTSLYNFKIRFNMCSGDFTLQNVECYSGKHEKWSSNFVTVYEKYMNI